ncbi:MAG: hypothetical protein MJH11_18340 [Lentisphaeria bacterium]|nr:hypothetical protein [Lentisphaeria bacterium]
MKLLLRLFLTFFIVGAFAQDGDAHHGKNTRGDRDHATDKRPRRQHPAWMKRSLEKLKQADPELYKKMLELQKSNPENFRKEMRKIMHEGFKQLAWLKKIHDTDPELFKELQALRKEDPALFRSRIRELFAEYHHEMIGQDDEIDNLIKDYKTANEADKAEIKEKLKAKISANFDKKQSSQKVHIKESITKLKELQKTLNKRDKKKAAIIDKILGEMIDKRPDRRRKRGNIGGDRPH